MSRTVFSVITRVFLCLVTACCARWPRVHGRHFVISMTTLSLKLWALLLITESLSRVRTVICVSNSRSSSAFKRALSLDIKIYSTFVPQWKTRSSSGSTHCRQGFYRLYENMAEMVFVTTRINWIWRNVYWPWWIPKIQSARAW